jgi:hypothetical protein
MSREPQHVVDLLEALTNEGSAALTVYHRLVDESVDPTARVVLALLIRETDHDTSLLRQARAGAHDAIDAERAASRTRDVRWVVDELRSAGRLARARAQQLRDLACRHRGMENHGLALLLEGIAMNSDKHAHLLAQLSYYFEIRPQTAARRDSRTP